MVNSAVQSDSITSSKRSRTESVSTTASVDVDPKKFKMADLISWRPSTENNLRKKWDAKRQLIEDSGGIEKIAEQKLQQPKPKIAAPRVKLNEKGEMVVDTDSLIVTETPDDNAWDVVHDDAYPKKLNSMSFKKTVPRSTGWTDRETDLFYLLLSATGSDFGLMHEFIPSRSRVELKKKFKREEQVNMQRVNETLKKPSLLDRRLYDHAKEIMKKVEEEKTEKKQKKGKSKKAVISEDSIEVEPEAPTPPKDI